MDRSGAAGNKSRLNVPEESPSRRPRHSLPPSVNSSPLRRDQQLPRASGSTDMLRDSQRAIPVVRLNGTEEEVSLLSHFAFLIFYVTFLSHLKLYSCII